MLRSFAAVISNIFLPATHSHDVSFIVDFVPLRYGRIFALATKIKFP